MALAGQWVRMSLLVSFLNDDWAMVVLGAGTMGDLAKFLIYAELKTKTALSALNFTVGKRVLLISLFLKIFTIRSASVAWRLTKMKLSQRLKATTQTLFIYQPLESFVIIASNPIKPKHDCVESRRTHCVAMSAIRRITQVFVVKFRCCSIGGNLPSNKMARFLLTYPPF